MYDGDKFEAVAAELERLVEALDVPARGDAIVRMVALHDRLKAKTSQAVEAFDAAKGYDLDAATSMTAWLRDKAAMTHKEAYRTASAARRLAPCR